METYYFINFLNVCLCVRFPLEAIGCRILLLKGQCQCRVWGYLPLELSAVSDLETPQAGADGAAFSALICFHGPEGSLCATGRERPSTVLSANSSSDNNDQPGRMHPWVQGWRKCYGGHQPLSHCISGPLHRKKHRPGM